MSSGCRPRKSPLASKGAFGLLRDERKGLATKLDGRDRTPLLAGRANRPSSTRTLHRLVAKAAKLAGIGQARLTTLAPPLVCRLRGLWRCATVSAAGRPGARPVGATADDHVLAVGRVAGADEHLDHARRGAGQEIGVALEQRRPTFIGWRPSTSFSGAMAAVARCSSICGGTGSWRRLCPPHHDDEPPCGVGKQWDGSAIRLPICPCVCPRLVPTPPT